jgi:hypothetical protein
MEADDSRSSMRPGTMRYRAILLITKAKIKSIGRCDASNNKVRDRGRLWQPSFVIAHNSGFCLLKTTGRQIITQEIFYGSQVS